MQKIYPCLWFDDEAEEAAKFYVSAFKNSKVTEISKYTVETPSNKPIGSVMTVVFELDGYKFMGLNGGAFFKPNPSISFFVYCKTKKEVDSMFNKLSKDGKVMMPLDKYPFSERYAFIADKFGVSWQIMLSKSEGISPCFLFVGDKMGKAEAAIKLYTKTFNNSEVDHIIHYGKKELGVEGTVKHSSFTLEKQEFIAMDGAGEHNFDFSEGISLIINCKDQKEIDYFYDRLSAVKEAEMCGWLKDKFGVSWQLVPEGFEKLMKKGSKRVMEELMKMKRLDLKKLEKIN